MPTVTVDIDDLERLVMTSGALKTIEGAIKQRREDPFVREHLDFTDAHNRLAEAVRHARRGTANDTLVGWEEDLTSDEIKAMRQLAVVEDSTGRGMLVSPDQKVGKKNEVMSVADRLAAKGCVVMGQLVNGIIWAGDPKPELVVDPSGFAIKLTKRGKEKLAALATKAVPAK